ncbi:unnamed protein product [Rotaria sp. Silwood2]|nr:unnamed protein product [Rotaria sp. Silwood2]
MESVVFIFNSVLLDILKRMSADEYAKQQLIDTCEKYYCNSKYDLNMIEHFRATFKPEDAIKWYTTNCFLFRLLNQALRTEDVNLLFAFRYYIIVLCKALADEKQKLSSNTHLKLFRGQKLAVTEFESLQKCIGTYITTNGFLSTSLDADVALMFAGHGDPCPESYCIILFEIRVNTSVESIIFASIDSESDFIDEKEVLFSLNTEFKIESIDYDDQRQLWIVRMIASTDGSRYVNDFLESARTEEKNIFTPLAYYGHIIWYEFQQLEQGEKYFQTLIKTLPADHPELSIIYYELGSLYQKKKEWFAALQNLTYARDLLPNSENKHNELIAMVWLTMGEVYSATGDLDMSLDYFQKALSIWNSNHSYLRKARTLECISKVYELKNPKHYQEIILDNYNKALDIYQSSLYMDNKKDKNCLQNIGHFHDIVGEYDRGLDYYKQALAMQLYQSCEDTETFLGDLYQLIKNLKKRNVEFGPMKTQDSAFILLNEIMNFRIRTLGENEDHPHIAMIIGSMGDLCEDTQLFVKMVYYKLTVTKLELSSGSTEILDRLFQYIEKLYSIYEQTNDYDNALQCLKRKLLFEMQHYPSHHINIVRTLARMGFLYRKIANNSYMAFKCFSQALTLYKIVEREDDTQDMEDNLTEQVIYELMNMRNSIS